MSEYIGLYLKADNHYIPLTFVSRCTELFQRLSPYATYGENVELSPKTIDFCIEDCHDICDNYKTSLADDKDMIANICTMNNPVTEKEERILHIQSNMAETKRDLQEVEYVIHFCRFLLHILEENKKSGVSIYIGYEAPDPNNEKDRSTIITDE